MLAIDSTSVNAFSGYDLLSPQRNESIGDFTILNIDADLGGSYTTTIALQEASMLYAQRNYNDAEIIFCRCLKTYMSVLGDKHPDTIKTMKNLGAVYASQQRYDEAEKLYISCLENRIEVLGENHQETLRMMNSLAKLYILQKKYNDAESLLVRCLEGRRDVLGVYHPETIESVQSLGHLHLALGRYLKATPLLREYSKRKASAAGEQQCNVC